MKKKEQQMDD